ncbi:hypothetical protein LDENG_00075200 [Lucifuga dentata]|nr:hypothetical protein LDENG_00075200 [Lucifuga dentata]
MASQPSVHSEERNLLRIRAWEQRNQERCQTKHNPENVPLFGEPYKTNKGDELSTRIQRMLGSYEHVNILSPSFGSFAMEPLPMSTHTAFSQSDQGQDNTDKSTKPPFHTHVHFVSTHSQKAPPNNTFFSQSMRKSTVSASPNHQGPSSACTMASMNHNQQKKSEVLPDLSPAQDTPSPDAEAQASRHSCDRNNTEPKDVDTKDTFDRHRHQGPLNNPSEYSNTVNVSSADPQQAPKDGSLPQASKGNALPSQTFPPLLPSKAPNVVMTQKPTAYVRPMDGQDQVVNESPELKPSPEPYEPPAELTSSKSNTAKMKMLPQFLETRTNEIQCVEDILKEMTHSWPPLLTDIHTPSTDDPSKSPFLAKEAENVPSKRPGQKNYESSPAEPSKINQQSSSVSFEAAHSSVLESASSSDSESSSRSESDSETSAEEPPQPCETSSAKTKPDVPAVTHGDWQLGNWIRSSQQNSSNDSQGGAQASKSPTHKRPLPTLSSRRSSLEMLSPTSKSKLQLRSHQKELSDSRDKPPSESLQSNCCQQSIQKSPSTDLSRHMRSRKTSGNTHPPKSATATCPAVKIKFAEAVAKRDKDPCFSDRPKVKTKTGHRKNSKDRSESKRDNKRTSEHASLDKQKAESEPGHDVTLVLNGHCPTCGVRLSNACSCPSLNPAHPDQLPPTSPATIKHSRSKTETTHQKGIKKPHKGSCPAAQQHTDKVSRDTQRPRESLLVKINLSLLSRIPQATNRPPSSMKRPAAAAEQHGGSSDAFTTSKPAKTSKKSLLPNVDVDYSSLPKKKPKPEKMPKTTQPTCNSAKLESCSTAAEDRERKKAKKNPLPVPQDNVDGSKVRKRRPGETQKSSKEALKSRDTLVKHKKSTGKLTEQPNLEKGKPPKSSFAVPSSSQPAREALSNRPLLKLEKRQYPVKHYIKEAKRLKHKADAETDKLSKAFNYLEAAMFFVESGIAMEKDPQISVSSYTMFAETVELLKFILKLKNSGDPSAPPLEKDVLALCMKCQSILQMVMFRYKHKTALKYSKTLMDHFNVGIKNSTQAAQDPSVSTSKSTDTPSPMSNMASSANVATSSGPAIEQVTFSYISITTLFLSAHELWEQAEELAHKGSGMLTELDSVLAPLSLASDLSVMVHYTRQGVHWLRLDTLRVK